MGSMGSMTCRIVIFSLLPSFQTNANRTYSDTLTAGNPQQISPVLCYQTWKDVLQGFEISLAAPLKAGRQPVSLPQVLAFTGDLQSLGLALRYYSQQAFLSHLFFASRPLVVTHVTLVLCNRRTPVTSLPKSVCFFEESDKLAKALILWSSLALQIVTLWEGGREDLHSHPWHLLIDGCKTKQNEGFGCWSSHASQG